MRLDVGTARAIAEQVAAGTRHTQIAASFGVSVETVGAIKSGKRWASAIDADLAARMHAAPAGTVLDAAGAARVLAGLAAGRTGRDIASDLGISPSMVSAVKHGRAWADADPALAATLEAIPARGKALEEAQVAAIKQQLAGGGSSRQVAAEFGVSASTVRSIAAGKTWAHVEASGRE